MRKPNSQMWVFFFYFNRGKPADTESMDRPVGEKRYEPIPPVTTPPPAPSVQYTQPQSINSPVLSLPAHHKPALSEGEQLGSQPGSGDSNIPCPGLLWFLQHVCTGNYGVL